MNTPHIDSPSETAQASADVPWWVWPILPALLPLLPGMVCAEVLPAALTRADRSGKPGRHGFDPLRWVGCLITECGAVVGIGIILGICALPFSTGTPWLLEWSTLLAAALAYWAAFRVILRILPARFPPAAVRLSAEVALVRSIWIGYPDQHRLTVVRGERATVWQLDYYGTPVVVDSAWIGVHFGAEFGRGVGAEALVRPIYPPSECGTGECRLVRITSAPAAGEVQRAEAVASGPGIVGSVSSACAASASRGQLS